MCGLSLNKADCKRKKNKQNKTGDFPGGAVVKNLPANAGDTGSTPDLGRSHIKKKNFYWGGRAKNKSRSPFKRFKNREI